MEESTQMAMLLMIEQDGKYGISWLLIFLSAQTI